MIIVLPAVTADPSRQPSATIRLFDPLGGTVVRLPWMPDEIETGNLAQAWDQLARPGRRPLLMSRGKELPTVSFPARLVHPGQQVTVQPTVDALTGLARSSNPLRLDVGGQFRGMWRITGLTCRETLWDRSGLPLDVEVDIELTQASDMVAAVGPIKRKTRAHKRGGIKGRRKGSGGGRT